MENQGVMEDDSKLMKHINLLQRIAFLDGQREMAWALSGGDSEKPLVGPEKIPWEDFVAPINHELRELRAQAGMPKE